jgi:hypothetical protein
MRRQAAQYDEEAGRRLTILADVAGKSIWALVAVFIIIAIFRIYSFYLGAQVHLVAGAVIALDLGQRNR